MYALVILGQIGSNSLWNFITHWLGLRMWEIPFPRTSILKLFWGRMPPNSLQGLTFGSPYIESPSLNSIIPHGPLVWTAGQYTDYNAQTFWVQCSYSTHKYLNIPLEWSVPASWTRRSGHAVLNDGVPCQHSWNLMHDVWHFCYMPGHGIWRCRR